MENPDNKTLSSLESYLVYGKGKEQKRIYSVSDVIDDRCEFVFDIHAPGSYQWRVRTDFAIDVFDVSCAADHELYIQLSNSDDSCETVADVLLSSACKLTVTCGVKRMSAERSLALLKQEYDDRVSRVRILTESERELQKQCKELSDELDAVKESRTYKLGLAFKKVFRAILPVGSRRARFCRVLLNIVRHPVRFLKCFHPRKIKKFFSLLFKGDFKSIRTLMASNINGDASPTIIQVVPPKIVKVDPNRAYSAADFPILEVPQWKDPQVSIVIPVYNQFAYTYYCVQSILKNSGNITYEIIIANDCSTDLTTRIDEIIPGVKCITNPENLRFLRNCNNAAKHATGKYVLFLNNDTQVQENWLAPLVELIESAEDIGMVGSKLIYPDGLLQEAGGILWKDGSAWNYGNRKNPALPEYNYVKQVDYISGAAIMLSRQLWEKIGGFDELFVPAYCEDSDLAFTVRKLGYRVMYQPKSVVVHFEGISNGTDTSSGQKKYQVDNSVKFREKWADELAMHPDNGQNVFQARDYSYGRKTLLMIDHYVPQFDRDAGSRTIYQYVKLFVELGYNVKFIGDDFFAHQPYTEYLEQMGVEVLYGAHNREGWKTWVQENAEHIQLVFMNRPHVSEKYIDFIKKHTNAKVFYNLCDLHFLREQRQYELTGSKECLESAEQWKKRELALIDKADRVFSLSTDEQKILNQYFDASKTVICPIFIYENFVDDLPKRMDTKDLLFVGGFNHKPNVDAVQWFCTEVFPLINRQIPGIKLHVVGSNPPVGIQKLQSEQIIIEGFVTDEYLDQLYRQCRVCVIPLRFGAGVKGKTIEAMYHGIPIVTTDIGIEGLPQIDQCITAHNDAVGFADEVVNIYQYPDLAKVQPCYDYVREHYSHESAKAFFREEFM